MHKWEKAGQMIGKSLSIITYMNKDYPGTRIKSYKERVKNESPRGFWEYTHFFVVTDTEQKEFWRLKDAKEYVENGGKENAE